jgi:hypothetical protein
MIAPCQFFPAHKYSQDFINSLTRLITTREPNSCIDNSILPREGHHITSTMFFLGFLVLGEGPRGHEILDHNDVLELVLDGVRVVQASLLEESLKVVYQWPQVALAIVRGDHDALHVGASHFLVVVRAVGRGHHSLRALLLPLLAALGVLCILNVDAEQLLGGPRPCPSWHGLRPQHLCCAQKSSPQAWQRG